MEANLRTELATTKTSLIKWMVTIMTAYTAAITALVTALARFLAGSTRLSRPAECSSCVGA